MTMIRLPARFARLVSRHRRVIAAAVAAAALGVAVAVLISSGSAMTSTTYRPPSAASYLFSIPTSSGSLTAANGRRHLTLRLTGAREYLTRFTDRPLREAFVVANTEFVSRYNTYFAASNPNAVLTYTATGDRVPVSIVLTIAEPRWNAQQRTWTFSATRIRKQLDTLPGTTVHIKPPFIPNPRRFAHATLLIDGTAPASFDGTQLVPNCPPNCFQPPVKAPPAPTAIPGDN